MIYVLAFPHFEANVLQSLAAFRGIHEPERAALVAPHVTLAFRIQNTLPKDMIALCQRVASQKKKFYVEFDTSEVVYDQFEDVHKLLLAISVGQVELTALHEQLYEGLHRQEPHPHLAYHPHMTIATNADPVIIENIDLTSIGPFPIKATINSLEVLKLEDGGLSSIANVQLGT